jgi:fumarylacetoacetase
MLKSWLKIPKNSDFPIENLPYGIFSVDNNKPRVGVAIGEYILDLKKTAKKGLFKDLKIDTDVFSENTLNDFIALGKPVWSKVRNRLIELLKEGNSPLKLYAEKLLVPQKDAQMHLPVKIGDYTDFYSSLEHASNVGSMFRDPQNPLLPNWRHLPVAYHGRASSIVISGTEIHRPKGQVKPADSDLPIFQASKLLDFELEMAFIVGKTTSLGQSVSTTEAEDHIFGMVLFNDWSARDIQTWEYQPLGPFLAKNFASAISPWIVTLEALEPFRCASPKQDPEVLPYLQYDGEKTFDIQLEVSIQAPQTEESLVCKSNFKYLYWNMSQQLAHHTINGCNLNVGDMCASGTISGASPDSYGSMLELTWRGTKPIQLKDGSERKFIEDYDTVVMRAYCEKENLRIGFGEVKNMILPAI